MSLARAEADLVSARNEVKRYEGLLDAARSRATKLEHYIEMAQRYAERDPDGDEPSGASRRPRGGKSGDAVETAILILREERKPLKTRDLADRLRDRGIIVSDTPERETANLSAYLSRTPELVGDRQTGWRLRDWEKEEAASPWDAAPASQPVATPLPKPPPPPLPVAPVATRRGGWDAPKSDLDDDIPF